MATVLARRLQAPQFHLSFSRSTIRSLSSLHCQVTTELGSIRSALRVTHATRRSARAEGSSAREELKGLHSMKSRCGNSKDDILWIRLQHRVRNSLLVKSSTPSGFRQLKHSQGVPYYLARNSPLRFRSAKPRRGEDHGPALLSGKTRIGPRITQPDFNPRLDSMQTRMRVRPLCE